MGPDSCCITRARVFESRCLVTWQAQTWNLFPWSRTPKNCTQGMLFFFYLPGMSETFYIHLSLAFFFLDRGLESESFFFSSSLNGDFESSAQQVLNILTDYIRKSISYSISSFCQYRDVIVSIYIFFYFLKPFDHASIKSFQGIKQNHRVNCYLGSK